MGASTRRLLGSVAVCLCAGTIFASTVGFQYSRPLLPAGTESANGRTTIGLPYDSALVDARDLMDDINLQAGADIVQAIEQFDPATDGFSAYAGSGVASDLIPGSGYLVQLKPRATVPVNYRLIGVHDDDAVILLNGTTPNKRNMIALPHHAVASDAAELISDIQGQIGQGAVQSVGECDPVSEKWSAYSGSGQAFELVPGASYMIQLDVGVTQVLSYTPETY